MSRLKIGIVGRMSITEDFRAMGIRDGGEIYCSF